MNEDNIIKLFMVDSFIFGLSNAKHSTLRSFMMEKHKFSSTDWRAYNKVYKKHLLSIDINLKTIL